MIYTIPTGQNPSGATLSNERRKQLYQVASQYNMLILEDDPYWDLRFEGEKDLVWNFLYLSLMLEEELVESGHGEESGTL